MSNAGVEVCPDKSRPVLLAILVLALCWPVLAQAPANSSGYYDPLPQDTGAAGLKLQLRKLQTTGRLMMVVAHPDDEDGGLLTREARGKGVETLLMTLTRGEGGQNKTGGTFSDELGVLRTLELLASDRYYGVEQRFSRVADFGYSKTAEETFQKWGGHDVPLQDIVRVIREFRPDVLIARFSGTDRDGHGHHQASSILTQEAFRAAADPKRFPDQIKEGLHPWQAKKLYIGNVCGFGASTCADENYTVKINTGEFDPVLGKSYVQFAIEGLRHQESQGLADISIPSGPRYAFYKLVDSTVPNTKDDKGHEKDLFDGVDTTLAQLSKAEGKDIPWLEDELDRIKNDLDMAERNDAGAESLLDAFQRLNASVGKISDAHLSDAAKSALIDSLGAKESEANAALNLALGVSLQAVTDTMPAVSPGDDIKVRVQFHNPSHSDLQMSYGGPLPRLDGAIEPPHIRVRAGKMYSAEVSMRVPGFYTRPHWSRRNPQRDSVYTLNASPHLALLPFLPALKEDAAYLLPKHAPGLARHGWRTPWPEISAPLIAEHSTGDAEVRSRPIAIVPEFSIALEPGQQVIPLSAASARTVKVGVTSNVSRSVEGTLRLELPAGWEAQPPSRPVHFLTRGEKQDLDFVLVPAARVKGEFDIRAILNSGGKEYSEGYTPITREDLGSFYYFHPAVQHISIVDVKVPKGLQVGYIMGAGDDIPSVLQQVGLNITLIPADKIASENLGQYGTIVLGVRAYDTHTELVNNSKKLLEFVSNGGTLIVQNNNSVGDFNGEHLTPYPAELSRTRVSVEEAPVTILAPGSPIFHYPNEITQKDFDGWVQERGLYFMDSWDDHFTPLLSCHDPGERDQKGGLLMAQYGKGVYIYTGYAFFRQLPAGVPGAIRLFVNLVSAGHEQ